MSDVFGDNFFEILSVFRVELHFFFFLRTILHGWASGYEKKSQAKNGRI